MTTGTLSSYITSIQRLLRKTWKLKGKVYSNSVLNYVVSGVSAVCNSWFAQQLSREVYVKNHNKLSAEDICIVHFHRHNYLMTTGYHLLLRYCSLLLDRHCRGYQSSNNFAWVIFLVKSIMVWAVYVSRENLAMLMEQANLDKERGMTRKGNQTR